MHEHMPAHGTTARQQQRRQRQGSGPLWRECLLQTYFTAKGRIDYFAVKEEGEEDGNKDANNEDEARIEDEGRGESWEAEQEEEDRKEALFRTLIRDLGKADDDLTEQAGVVQDFDGSRSARVAWLGRTGFPAHLRGLRDEEIRSSYTLPPKRVLDGLAATGGGSTGDDDECREEEDPDLVRILVAAESMPRDAYDLCSETSPDRKILNEFYAGASGRSAGFRYFKNESTLVEYFRRAKELLAYFYRVVYCEDGHFTRERADQIVPRDVIEPVIEPNSAQQRAMRDISKALRRGRKETGEGEEEEEEDEGEGEEDEEEEGAEDTEAALKHAIRRLYMGLICHTVGSVPFRSPVLSFCAMRSHKVYGGTKPGGQGGRGGRGVRRGNRRSDSDEEVQLTVEG